VSCAGSRPEFRIQSDENQRRRAWLALLMLVPAPSIGTVAAFFLWPGSAIGYGLFVAAKFWLVLFPLAWSLLIDRQPLSWSPARRAGFGPAIVSGVLIACVIFAAATVARRVGLLDSEMIAERAARTGMNHKGVYLAGAAYWITANSLMEEYVWRWFVFRKCEIVLGGKAAVAASAIGFTAHHVIALAAQFNWTVTALASTGVFIGGATWSWLYLRYRSVWPCYVSHAIADVPIFVVGWQLIFG
jgi:membrane protease YdiL (CAAX protease family)